MNCKIMFIILVILIIVLITICIFNKSDIGSNMNLTENFVVRNELLSTNVPVNKHISFKPIVSNTKLYYGLTCQYLKDDCFYDALKLSGYISTDDITRCSLVVPCSYETTEEELVRLKDAGIGKNVYGDGVRIFMLNNTDHMVSKLALWKYLKLRHGIYNASNIYPYTWDLTSPSDVEVFVKQYDKNKLYVTKNNKQRQEGISIHTSLDSILGSIGDYILVQELLQDPYLIAGRKINLRVYVLVIRDNYGNATVQVYNDGFMYYTPELFEKANPDFKRNITTGYIDRQVYKENPLTHGDFKKWLDDGGRDLTVFEKYVKKQYGGLLSNYVFSQIYQQLKCVFESFEDVVGIDSQGVNFQIYGVDVAIDQHLKPMIMEINKGPDLTAKDGRDRDLKIGMCTDVLESVGLIDSRHKKISGFITILETVNIGGTIVSIDNNEFGK